ncbi:hypothetical protein [Sphingobacterium faecium]|uniref:hypothetical protein n=1 Tax=Sphingobacterium faecium TaxID=34087 RepID=UPI003208549D
MKIINKNFSLFSRNYILITLAVLVTWYGLFLASTFYLQVYSIGILVLLIPCLEIRSHQVVMQLFFIFFICMMISSISVFDRLPYKLLLVSQPFWIALKYGIALALGLCSLAYFLFYKNTNLIKICCIQFPIMIITCTWYIRMILILNNCQHIPNAKSVHIPAVVIQKCPVCSDIHELWFSFHLEGKDHHVSMDVNPRLHERSKEGDTLILQVHPGAYGWPWYHKDIKRRYK